MRLVRIAVLMALQYALMVFNMRMVAAGSYLGTVGSDALILSNGIILTKFTVQTETWAEKAALVVGGCVGSTLSLWLTK